MMTKRSRVGAGAAVLVLVSLLTGTATDAFQAKDMEGAFAFRMVPVKSFAADAPGDPAGVARAPR